MSNSTSKKSLYTCSKCNTVPAITPETGTLFLKTTTPEVRQRLRACLSDEGVALHGSSTVNTLAITLLPGLLKQLAEQLPSTLSTIEIRSIHALIIADDHDPTLSDYMKTQPLEKLLDSVRYGWLNEVLRESRLETHFQPIVTCDDPTTVHGYECLLRGRHRDGELIPPNTLFHAARVLDLLFQLDRRARVTAISTAARQAFREQIFINFNPSSIYVPTYCLQSTFEAVAPAGLKPSRIVFEVVESEEVADTEHLLKILTEYRRAGFKVALDDVGAGYNTLNLLTKLRPDYVKFDMALTRNIDTDIYKGRIVSKLLEMTQDLGILTVVEGVETEGEFHWARDHGADFVQGYLFGRPSPEPKAPNCRMTAHQNETVVQQRTIVESA